MLIAGGGGGGGGTPWFEYGLPRMWQIANGQDVDALWQHASGWKKVIELTSLNMYNLKEYKDQLAEAWPPQNSPAAAAYVAELDKLIASVKETNDTASTNYTAVVNLALAVGDAKYKLKPLYEEFQQNETKLADYNQQMADYNDDNFVQHIFESKPDKPVADGRQDQLNNQARSIMYSISSEVTTAGASMAPPKPYVPPKGGGPTRDDTSSTGSGSSGGGTPVLVPPVIPPITSTAPPPPIASPPRDQLVFPTSSGTGTTTPGFGDGPVLGGTPTPTPAPPRPIIQPPPPPPPFQPVPVPPPHVIGPTPPPGYGPPGGGLPPKTVLPTTGLPKGLGGGPEGPGGYPRGLGTRPMPPGGVIGEPSNSGLARPGAGRPLSRVNPPGGMIGEEPGGAGAAGRTGAAAGRTGGAARPGGAMAPGGSRASGGAMGMPGSRSGRRGDGDQEMQHWDPDNPWETEEGVAPVVLPPDEPKRHDPGPAIGQGR